MNYGELKQAILDDTHRPDLVIHVERFIRQCEGMIRRQLTGYLLSTTIDDTNRVADGIYNLPARSLMIRYIIPQGRQGDSLQRVTPNAIRRLAPTADVIQYAEYGDGTIEFRGNPGTDTVFDILYYGTPAPFVDDTDENELLTDHESLYMAGSKFYLYLHTQDRELALDELEIFNSLVETLNEQVSRKVSGANIAPTYNFRTGSSY